MTDDFVDVLEIEEKWHTDFPSYSQDLLKIQTMEGDLLPFRFNEVQTILDSIIDEIKSKGRLVRIIILKARREGISTYTTGRFYWKTSTNFNRYGMIITHEPDATDFLFGMVKRYHVHNEWKPEIRYSNKRILEFNTKDGKGLDSAVRVATAGKEDVGSAQLIHHLHLSEVAKWPSHTAEPLLTSILQCVPKTEDSEVVFESTAKGIGGEFYERYWASRYQYEIFMEDGKPAYKCTINENADPNNAYSAIFIPWFVFSSYKMDVPEDFNETEEEEELIKLYSLTREQLQWRRWAIPNLCGGDKLKFMQEYPSNAVEAFLSSGQSIFSAMQLLDCKKNAPDPIARYELQISSGNWITELHGRLRVWAEPVSGRQYVIGADVAEGLVEGDASCADVIDQLTGEHMAQWHGKIDPDLYAKVLYFLGHRYNIAWVAPERNNHGLTTVTELLKMGYPKIYVEKVPDPPNRTRKRYGWLTSRTSKPKMIDNLVTIMREWEESQKNQIRSRHTFDEMMSFKQDEKGKLGAEDGRFDDRVISIGIAHEVRLGLPLPANAQKNHVNFNLRPMNDETKTPSTMAWT